METNNAGPYVDPVSDGICEVRDCSKPATHRISWSQGIVIRRVCSTHKAQMEKKSFEELSSSVFESKRQGKIYIRRFHYDS
jgi:hypothetical protein